MYVDIICGRSELNNFVVFLGSGPVGDDDLWHHHIGRFSPFSFPSVRPSVSPPPWGLPPDFEALLAGIRALPAGSEALPAGPEALPAGSESLPAGSEALPAGSEALPAGSEAHPA